LRTSAPVPTPWKGLRFSVTGALTDEQTTIG
jgi:hypothetical protein